MNKKADSLTRIHHPFSPSKLQCLESCPKYHSAFTESEAAATGTKQHDVAEDGIDDASLPDYKAMAVVECMKFVDDRKALYPGCRVIKEEYLPIDDNPILIPGEPTHILADPSDPESEILDVPTFTRFVGTTAGYLDVGIVSKDETAIEVIDFKFGQVAVEPANNNLQGIAYVLGLAKRFPKVCKATVWFIMPHRDEIDGVEFTADQFGGFYPRIRTVVHRAIEANKDPEDFSMATPNQSACLFCSLVGRCPKVAEVALKVGKKYAPLDIPSSVSTTIFTDPEQIATGLKLAAVIKVWAEAYRSQATAKTIDDQNFIPKGYTLVPSQRRTVVKAKALGDLAKTYLPAELQPKVEALYDIPLGSLEKLISTAAVRGQKEKTVDAFGEKAIAAGLVELGTPFAFLKQSKKI